MPQSTLSVSMGEKTGHKKLPIREVARETGLSPYVIRENNEAKEQAKSKN